MCHPHYESGLLRELFQVQLEEISVRAIAPTAITEQQ